MQIENIHESPMVMVIPLIILSIGAIFAGYLFKDLFITSLTILDSFFHL